jgi:hypothetical protein
MVCLPANLHTQLKSQRCKEIATFIITAMVMSSPVFMFAIPTQVSAATITNNFNGVDTSDYHSNMPVSSSSPTSTVSQDEDFTTQADLSLTRATQTSNIVDSKSYYDITFRTGTSGVIKSVRMSFPVGTYLGAAVLIEATGIGSGTISAGAGGNTLAYTVNNAVDVPANTIIRIQIANANNPPTPSTTLTVSITTRDSANAIIDGPTSTNAYNIKQIGTGQIADGAVTGSKIAGTQKLLFARCIFPPGTAPFPAASTGFTPSCSVLGAEDADDGVAEYIGRTNGFFSNDLELLGMGVGDNSVSFFIRNNQAVGGASIPLDGQQFSVIIFKPIASIEPI